MKTKKILLIITALCCTMTISACNKKQNDTSNAGNVSRETTASKTVEKSGETNVIDVFSELNVTFEGENGSGEIICEYTGDNEFIKYDVEFKGDRNGRYKNGDTAVVKLDYSDYRAESANVFFKEKEHEYPVEGLWGVILNSDGYDFSECNKALTDRLFDKERSDTNSDIKEFDVGNTFMTHYNDEGQSDISTWKIISVGEYEAIQGKLVITNPNKVLNEYTLFYKVTVLGEKIEVDSVFQLDEAINSKYTVGEKKEWTYIISETTRNVFVEKDSNIVKTNPEAITTGAGKVMSMREIYRPGLKPTDYNGNFDEYYDENIFINLHDYEVYDIEIK